MENKLDKLFRNQLSKHEETPSMNAWEQIHRQLASNRKSLWIKRLSIAASIILIATAGFVGYRSLSDLAVESNPGITESTLPISKLDSNLDLNNQEKLVEPSFQDNSTKTDIEESMQEDEIVAITSTSKDIIISTPEIESPVEDIEIFEPVIAEIKLMEDELDTYTSNEEKISLINEEVENIEQADVALNDHSDEQSLDENPHPEKQVKSYPKVKIIYKANQDSELVASGKQTLINKGINKITNFTDEHLLTAERKTKLRNTKEDLLALNFGKLLNKSNKDLEN